MNMRLKLRTLSALIVDQLRQDALAEAYGASQIPVREALFQLEAEEFVQRAQGGHEELVGRYRSGDGKAACALLTRHIATVYHDLVGLLTKRPILP